MRHVSTPESRRKARVEARVIGNHQRHVEARVEAITARVLASKLAPLGAMLAGLAGLHVVLSFASKLP